MLIWPCFTKLIELQVDQYLVSSGQFWVQIKPLI